MAIPDFQSIMLPLLIYLKDGKEHYMQEIIEAMSTYFDLTPEEKKQLLSSGQQAIFDNRVGWARTYMKKAGLVESTRRGYIRITERGLQVLKENPEEINVRYLMKFPEFVVFRTLKRDRGKTDSDADESQTPEEQLDLAYQKLRGELAAELLQRVRKCTPHFFERLIIVLLVSMGYGGTRKDAGEAVGGSGDEGIDGVIKEDRLGLDEIYIQAKKWEGPVGRPEIQKFAGALMGRKAKKGIFITTSTFTKEAKEYAEKIESKIVLIDGDTLAQLMIDHDIGVSSMVSYSVKRIDNDYFSEE